MDVLNPQSLRKRAQFALRRGREPKKITYAYAGITLAIGLVIFLADLWLDNQISGTGGLSNLGSRAIFSTAQQAIPMLSTFVAMCLDLGYLSGLMRISRGQYADHTDLKTGFRKFWPLVRLSLIQVALYVAIAILAMQAGTLLFMLTPWADPLMDVLYPLAMSGATTIEETVLLQLAELMVPMLVVIAVVFLVILMPFLYRMRMAPFFLLDDPRGRAMAAIRGSSQMMRRRFGQMLKIDLSLWLYYLVTALMNLVLWLDVILAMLGIVVPMDGELFSLVIYGLSLLLQFGLLLFLRTPAEVTYLTAYDSLREKPEDSGVVLGNIFDM